MTLRRFNFKFRTPCGINVRLTVKHGDWAAKQIMVPSIPPPNSSDILRRVDCAMNEFFGDDMCPLERT